MKKNLMVSLWLFSFIAASVCQASDSGKRRWEWICAFGLVGSSVAATLGYQYYGSMKEAEQAALKIRLSDSLNESGKPRKAILLGKYSYFLHAGNLYSYDEDSGKINIAADLEGETVVFLGQDSVAAYNPLLVTRAKGYTHFYFLEKNGKKTFISKEGKGVTVFKFRGNFFGYYPADKSISLLNFKMNAYGQITLEKEWKPGQVDFLEEIQPTEDVVDYNVLYYQKSTKLSEILFPAKK